MHTRHVRVIDLSIDEEVVVLQTNNGGATAEVSHDGKYVIVVNGRNIHKVDVGNRTVDSHTHDQTYLDHSNISITQNNEKFAVCCEDGTSRIGVEYTLTDFTQSQPTFNARNGYTIIKPFYNELTVIWLLYYDSDYYYNSGSSYVKIESTSEPDYKYYQNSTIYSCSQNEQVIVKYIDGTEYVIQASIQSPFSTRIHHHSDYIVLYNYDTTVVHDWRTNRSLSVPLEMNTSDAISIFTNKPELWLLNTNKTLSYYDVVSPFSPPPNPPPPPLQMFNVQRLVVNEDDTCQSSFGLSCKHYGSSISASRSGNRVAFGLFSKGKVYVFEKREDGMQQLGDAIVGTVEHGTGLSVKLSNDGTTLFSGEVNAPCQYDDQNCGVVKIYTYISTQLSVDAWRLQDILYGSTHNEHFGWSIAVSSDAETLAISSPLYNVNDQSVKIHAGIVRVYRKNIQGSYSLQKYYLGVASEQKFGYSLDLNLPYLVVGSPKYSDITNSFISSGQVEIFKQQNSVWLQNPIWLIKGYGNNQQMGLATRFSNNNSVLVLSKDNVKVFQLSVGTTLHDIPLESGLDGWSMAVSESRIVVGASDGTQSIVLVYELYNNTYNLLGGEITESLGSPIVLVDIVETGRTVFAQTLSDHKLEATDVMNYRAYPPALPPPQPPPSFPPLPPSPPPFETKITGDTVAVDSFKTLDPPNEGVGALFGSSISFSRTGLRFCVSETSTSSIHVYDIERNGTITKNNTFVEEDQMWTDAVIDENGNNVFAAASGSGRVYKWNAHADPTYTYFGEHYGSSIAINADGTRIAVRSQRGGLQVNNINTATSTESTWSPSQLSDLEPTLQTSRVRGKDVSLSSDGEFLVSGHPFANLEKGSVQIWRWDGNQFEGFQTIENENFNPGTHFGFSIALSGNSLRLIVGAPDYSSSNSFSDPSRGQVTVFERSDTESSFTFQRSTSFNGIDSNVWAGHSVAISRTGERIAFGARGNGLHKGYIEAYVLHENNYNQWNFTLQDVNFYDGTGYSVELAEEWLAYGVRYANSNDGMVKLLFTSNRYAFDITEWSPSPPPPVLSPPSSPALTPSASESDVLSRYWNYDSALLSDDTIRVVKFNMDGSVMAVQTSTSIACYSKGVGGWTKTRTVSVDPSANLISMTFYGEKFVHIVNHKVHVNDCSMEQSDVYQDQRYDTTAISGNGKVIVMLVHVDYTAELTTLNIATNIQSEYRLNISLPNEVKLNYYGTVMVLKTHTSLVYYRQNIYGEWVYIRDFATVTRFSMSDDGRTLAVYNGIDNELHLHQFDASTYTWTSRNPHTLTNSYYICLSFNGQYYTNEDENTLTTYHAKDQQQIGTLQTEHGHNYHYFLNGIGVWTTDFIRTYVAPPPPPIPSTSAQVLTCTDTCSSANNGICEDPTSYAPPFPPPPPPPFPPPPPSPPISPPPYVPGTLFINQEVQNTDCSMFDAHVNIVLNNLTSTDYLFSGCTNIQTVTFFGDTSSITSMRGMFHGATDLGFHNLIRTVSQICLICFITPRHSISNLTLTRVKLIQWRNV